MKLLVVIVQKEDYKELERELIKNEIYMTKLSSSGGFLKQSNITLLIGVEDKKLEEVFKIIKENCRERQTIRYIEQMSYGGEFTSFINPSIQLPVTIGGATVFVLDVEKYKKF